MARFRDDMLAYYQEDSMGEPTIDDVIAQIVAQQAPQVNQSTLQAEAQRQAEIDYYQQQAQLAQEQEYQRQIEAQRQAEAMARSEQLAMAQRQAEAEAQFAQSQANAVRAQEAQIRANQIAQQAAKETEAENQRQIYNQRQVDMAQQQEISRQAEIQRQAPQPTTIQEVINQISAQQSQPMLQPKVQQMAQQVDGQNETTGQPLLDRSNIEQVIAQITQQPVQQPTPEAQPVASKSDVIANLTSQIQAQGTTSNWTGGVGAEASAKGMAKILADTGITDINQFGKIQKVEPVEVTGYSLNGNNVQRTSANSYYEQVPEYDSEGGVTYRRRDLSPQDIAQVKTSYGVVTQTGDENNPQVVKPASEVTMKDGQLVGVTGETFGNKLTGQEVPQTYSERQTGEFFGGTFEGKGNTGYGVKFGADGTPIFYAQGASSTDKLVTTLMPMVQIALAATGAGGVLGNALLGTGANQIVASALGGALLGGGTSAIAGQDAVKGALLGGAGGALSEYLSGVLSGLDTPAGLTERGFAIADAKQLAASGIPTNQIAEILTASGVNDVMVNSAIKAISPTVAPVTPSVSDAVVITAPPAAPVPTATQLINTIAAQQKAPALVPPPIETVNVAAPKAQPEKPQTPAELIKLIATPPPPPAPTPPAPPVVPEIIATGKAPTKEPVPSIPILSPVAPVVPVAPEVVVTGQAPIKEPEVSPTFPITMSPTAPTVVPQEPIKVEKEKEKKWTAGELADLARLGLLATTVFGMADGGSGSTQYDIVPVPADWKSPVYQKDLPANTGAMTQLPAIDFGNRNLLIGTQWEKFLDPNYGQVPAPIQFSQPSSLSYQDLMGILGSKAGMPASSTLSINDVISGIQNQYGQIPSGSMGQKPT